MSHRALTRLLILASTAAGPDALAAWSPPDPAPAVDCTFAIKTTNDTRTEVWLMLAHSFWEGTFGTLTQKHSLNLQNRRLLPGESVDLRYTATSGTCSKNRNWRFFVQKGADAGYWPNGQYFTHIRKATRDADDRELFLGRVSTWSWATR